MSRLRLHRDAASVAFHDPLADGKANARALVGGAGVKTLKDDEDAVEVLGLDADAVVLHRDRPAAFVLLRIDAHDQRLRAAELQRVADQVLEQLHHRGAIARQHRQRRRPLDRCARIGDRLAEVGQGQVQRLVQAQRPHLDVAPRTGITQQIDDQPPHSLRPFGDVAHELAGFFIEERAVPALQQLRVAGDHAQRLREVVRRDVGKLLQIAVGPCKILHAQLEFFLRAYPLGHVAGYADDEPTVFYLDGAARPLQHAPAPLRRLLPDLGGQVRVSRNELLVDGRLLQPLCGRTGASLCRADLRQAPPVARDPPACRRLRSRRDTPYAPDPPQKSRRPPGSWRPAGAAGVGLPRIGP